MITGSSRASLDQIVLHSFDKIKIGLKGVSDELVLTVPWRISRTDRELWGGERRFVFEWL